MSFGLDEYRDFWPKNIRLRKKKEEGKKVEKKEEREREENEKEEETGATMEH